MGMEVWLISQRSLSLCAFIFCPWRKKKNRIETIFAPNLRGKEMEKKKGMAALMDKSSSEPHRI